MKTSLPRLDDIIAEIEGNILKYDRLLESSPRSDPNRPTLLHKLAELRTQHFGSSSQRSYLDKAITHLTETALLSSTQRIIFALFHLASLLLLRFTSSYGRADQGTDDIKSSIKYLRFLRTKFHSLEAFNIPQHQVPPPHTSEDLSTHLFDALAHNLVLTPGEMVQNLEEMVPLIPEFITAKILTFHQKLAIQFFGMAVDTLNPEMFRHENTLQVVDRAIQVLREATMLNKDLGIAHALALCLAFRFETTFVMKDCEEAIANFDRIVSTCSSENSPTVMQESAMRHISSLLSSRVNLSPTPEHLEDGIHRLRALAPHFSSDEDATQSLTRTLEVFTHMRLRYFGVTVNSRSAPLKPDMGIRIIQSREQCPDVSEIQRKLDHLREVAFAIKNDEIKDIEATVEYNRKMIPLQQSSDQWTVASGPTSMFANILALAYQRTGRLDYLNEAIITYRIFRRISAIPKVVHFDAGRKLHDSLNLRLKLLHLPQDLEEAMQTCSELAHDSSGEVFTRVEISCSWAPYARVILHPSASIAYESAMSLLQETLLFCPTLQTQHDRLTDVLRKVGNFPSDYASYLIDNGKVKQAIETLERGRALIWSEMRGLHTSTDQLRAADPALADNFSNINKELESVTMSVARSDDDDLGCSETGTRPPEHSIGHLVLTQRRLLEERKSLISHIQSLPGLENFLKSPSFDFLNSAASHGPVIIVNESQAGFSSHIILLLKNSRPFIVSTPPGFHRRAHQLMIELLRTRKEKGLDSEDYDLTLASVLSGLYELVGKPVIERLRKLKVPEKSRVWWCPTGAFCSLPLHAMGPIPSDDGEDLYFSDMFIPSYTPTLSALIESRKHESLSDVCDKLKPSILLVAQPDALPGAFSEIKAIEATKTSVKSLISAMATPETVLEGLRDHRFAHFACHGLLETGKPFDASIELHNANLTLLEIVRSQLPTAEFAFLAACHTAELTEDSVADEGLHLTAAMQYCGFRSVVGTMWAMADTDGADLSKHFYKTIFADKADQNGVPYHERSARALHSAVKKLRKKRGMTLERWVNFVHYGA